MDINEVWDYSLYFLYDGRFVNSLAEFLKNRKIESILDCACGTGFPSIELKKRGFDVTCSDGNDKMLKMFEQNLEKVNVKISHFKSKWSELAQKTNKKFDFIMCRGNSLIYANSWDKKGYTKLDNIETALRNFYGRIKPGGLLYVDTIHEKDFEKNETVKREYPQKVIEGKRIKLIYNTTHHYPEKVRTWNHVLFVDGKKHEFTNNGYLLTPKELVKLLETIGFKSVEKINLEGEDHYSIFIAKK